MKLFIKCAGAANNFSYKIFDERGKEKYYVIRLGKKSRSGFVITDLSQKMLLKIRRVPIAGAEAFVMRSRKTRLTFVCMLVKNELRCLFYNVNWHINGSIRSQNYSISDVDNSVIASHKKRSDYSELDIYKGNCELETLAVSICLSQVKTVDNYKMQAV